MLAITPIALTTATALLVIYENQKPAPVSGNPTRAARSTHTRPEPSQMSIAARWRRSCSPPPEQIELFSESDISAKSAVRQKSGFFWWPADRDDEVLAAWLRHAPAAQPQSLGGEGGLLFARRCVGFLLFLAHLREAVRHRCLFPLDENLVTVLGTDILNGVRGGD